MDSTPEAKPQFNYNIPAKINPKTNRPINPPMTFRFKEQAFTIVNSITQKEFMKINTLNLKDKEQFFKWYKDIFAHGLHQGIYIPILKSASKESTLSKA
eukprot:12578657-Ditylum_brightwellii.AAC.1